MNASPNEQVARLYEQAETQAAQAAEKLVGTRGFAALLGQLAENAAALTKLSADAMDLVLRNLRVAGRRDIVRLARQLARTEDKLEQVLQEVEQLRDEQQRSRASANRSGDARSRSNSGSGAARRGRQAGSGSGSGAKSASGSGQKQS